MCLIMAFQNGNQPEEKDMSNLDLSLMLLEVNTLGREGVNMGERVVTYTEGYFINNTELLI